MARGMQLSQLLKESTTQQFFSAQGIWCVKSAHLPQRQGTYRGVEIQLHFSIAQMGAGSGYSGCAVTGLSHYPLWQGGQRV